MNESPRPTSDLSEGEAVLRAKYLDYCSARVAELFLSLSPDEIFVIADEDAAADAVDEGPYERLVRKATVQLAERLGLPPFEEWSATYSNDPTVYEPYLMGLWTDGATR